MSEVQGSPSKTAGPRSPAHSEHTQKSQENGIEEGMGDDLFAEGSLAQSSLTSGGAPPKPEKPIVAKYTRAKVNITWEKVGKRKKIKVPKRLMSIKERTQLKRQRDKLEEQENNNKPPPEVAEVIVDLRSPEEKLQAARAKLKNLGGINKLMGGISAKKSMLMKMTEEEREALKKQAEEDDEEESLGFMDILFGAKVKARSDKYAQIAREEADKANRKPGVRDWPPWLFEFSKPRLVQARNARVLDSATARAAKDPEAEKELRQLQKKAKTLILPRLTYKKWSDHVPLVPDKRDWSVKPNLRLPGDYFRMDSIGWTPEDKYVFALKSPLVEKHMDNVYGILKEFLKPASKDGEKKLGVGEKIKVMELGCGSGEHAVKVCQNHKDVFWQPTDNTEVCLESTNKRAKFFGVLKNNTPQGMNGNLNEAFKMNILYYEKAMKELDPKWRSVDAFVLMNVLQYTPFRFIENFFKMANEVVRVWGTIFVYGPFRVDGELTREQEIHDMEIKKLSAKWGIRDQEDIVAIASQHMCQLEMKFDMDGNNCALVFKKTPKVVKAKVEEKEEKVETEEGEEGKEKEKRKTAKSRLTGKFRSVKNMSSVFRKSGFFRKTKSGKGISEGVEGGEEGEGGEDREGGGEKEGEEEGEVKSDDEGSVQRGEGKTRATKKNPRRRASREGIDGSGSDSDGTTGSGVRGARSGGGRKSMSGRNSMSGRKSMSQNPKGKAGRESREQQRSDRKSRMSKVGSTAGKGGKLTEKAASAKADALAEAAMSKFL